MNSATRKRILIICRKAPYGNSLAIDAATIALATSPFDQELAIIFTGDGVYQLLKEQDSSDINTKNISKLLSAFPLYDINDIYIDNEALQERQLVQTDLVLDGILLNRHALSRLINSYEIIFNF